MPARGSPKERRSQCCPTPKSCTPIWESTMLKLENVSVWYGMHEALHSVSLEAPAGKTTVILGANGAGKTTLLKAIGGLIAIRPGGKIMFEGQSIEGVPPHKIVAHGIALVPEGRRLFGEMTVVDNLRLGAYTER